MMDNSNKLAYIVNVDNLVPIPGRDFIELAIIKGWKCIVKKGEFSVNDKAVYISINSIPDFDDNNFKFLQEKKIKYIKTLKINKVISQGLLCPMSWLESRGYNINNYNINDNVTNEMGITKYIPAEEASQYENNNPRQLFPEYVPKTDSTRLQNDPDYYLNNIINKEIVITRKEDGCSCTCIYNNNNFLLCGRNYVWDNNNDRHNQKHYYNIVDKYNIINKLQLLNKNLAIQGEIVGPKVNSNRLKLSELDYIVFDIYDIDEQHYLLYEDMITISNILELKTVPLLYKGNSNNISVDLDYFLELANNTKYNNNTYAEGIVVKTNEQNRIQFKVISNNYLLKYNL